MKYIDTETWERKAHFEFFYRADYPQFNVCMNLDISKFISFVKEKELPFYFAMMFAVMKTVNTIADFRYRIRSGKVVLHDKVHPSFTYLNSKEQSGLFKLVIVDMADNIFDFALNAGEAARNQKEYFPPEALTGRDDLIYITCLPWISFTHTSHTISLNRDDSVPRISWGKYFKDGDRLLLPFSVQVNHAVADGYQVGLLVEKLQNYLDNFE
jgi:chloramphenicol O-acetyltransferase type A